MADRPPIRISEKLDSFVKGLPDDTRRLRLLEALMDFGGSARVVDLARQVSADAPGEAAQVIIAAAKDGLVIFVDDDNSAVRITDLGARLAGRQSKTAY